MRKLLILVVLAGAMIFGSTTTAKAQGWGWYPPYYSYYGYPYRYYAYPSYYSYYAYPYTYYPNYPYVYYYGY